MRADRLAAVLLGALAGASAIGCAASIAPRGWRPTAREAQVQGFGGWIAIAVRDGAYERSIQGELLAISSDSVFTLGESGVVASALGAVTSATLETYDPQNGWAARWTIAGTLLTITHGVGLVLTAPLWVLVGSISTSTLSHEGRLSQPRASWADLRLYARFPQGLPPGLDRAALTPRPREHKRAAAHE